MLDRAETRPPFYGWGRARPSSYTHQIPTTPTYNQYQAYFRDKLACTGNGIASGRISGRVLCTTQIRTK